MAYEAIVTKIRTRPHPNADRLQLGTCHGFQVVVGLETQDGELGVFFPTDGQLSEEFVLANDLYSESARLKLGLENKPEQRFGFFSDKRRVRSQSFRGQKSDGFWVPISYFRHWLFAEFPFLENETFTEMKGTPICNRYETPATRAMASNRAGRRQRENKCFPKHDVTKQFRYVAGAIPPDAILYITEKLHGTSGRYGYVPDEVPLPRWKRVVNTLLQTDVFKPKTAYTYLNGSKNVIVNDDKGGWYGTNEFRLKAVEGLELYKGEVLYFEIVGYIDEQRPIMNPHVIKDEVKSLKKQYPEIMLYDYGLEPPNVAIYVYRILRMNEDGVATELSWNQVNARCAELGLQTVPELGADYYRGDLEALTKVVESLTDGPSTLDSGHIREGVVIRVEHQTGTSYIKHKSWHFGVLEGYIKDSEEYVDEEESS